MRAAVGILAAVAATAQAQPVTRPSEVPCTVQVLEAPAAVRAEIERWVRAEPRCERELSVRVTPVRGGLRLVATETGGRVRERVVPDAASAAVLVVSWMADDSINGALDELDAATPVEVAPPSLTPVRPAPAPVIDHESPLAPAIEVRMPVRMLRHRWLSLGATAGEVFGVHAQADLLEHGAWTLGVAGGLRQGADHMRHDNDVAGDATVFVAYTRPVGAVDLRAQLGLGVDVRDDDRMAPGRVEAKAQAGVFVRLHLAEDWGVLGGPLVDAPLDGRSLGVSAFVGLERRW